LEEGMAVIVGFMDGEGDGFVDGAYDGTVEGC